MPKAIQLRSYGGVDTLEIVERAKPTPAADEIVVRVVAAGTNPGEIAIREGYLKDMFPKKFPFGQGTDFAGVIDSTGSDVTEFAAGDEVIGWTEDRASQADFVVSKATELVRKPAPLDWFRAGSLFVTGTTATAAIDSVGLASGDVVAISGAAGGVGSLAVQLARRRGARVIGIASKENAGFLGSVGVEQIAYGDGVADRLRAAAPNGIDAFVDLFGGGYVDLALELGVAKNRIDTIIDFEAAAKHEIQTQGSAEAANRETLANVADLVAWGKIVMPLAAIYPFAMVREAYEELAKRKSNGKIVLALALDASVGEPIHPPSDS